MTEETNDDNKQSDPAPMTRHATLRHFLVALLPAIAAYVLSGAGQTPVVIFGFVLLLGFVAGIMGAKMAAKSGQ